MKPALFVDFDKTLCHDRFWRSLPKEQYEQIQQFLIQENRAMMDDWLRGRYTAEEINAFVAKELGLPEEELWEVFVSDAKTMRVPVELLELIQLLRSRFQTVLATVNMDSFDRFTVPALGLDRYFGVIVNSSNDGRFKHEEGGSIFVDWAKKLDASLSESYLLDDSERNCTVFEALSGTALHVTAEMSAQQHLEKLVAVYAYGTV